MDSTQDKTARERRQGFIAAQKKWLVEKGDSIGELAKGNAEWASQARSIWEAARTETEPLVLLNLLRYQSARNKNWRSPENVFQPMEGAIKDCIEKTRNGDGEGLALDLIRLLLVYTIRSYTFHSKSQKKKAGS